ncbi:DUF4040 domain-containing protein [Ectothiorhodospiraceae bacterium 2226]|nr:DUF4040 domain-containing protein [Ectothiorhodospiraceae bacterium 2226]
MSIVAAVFDAVLGLMLIWLAWRLLRSDDLFKAVVLFIVFGLMVALAWARLGSPDLALAEAAIGAGLTGVLLLITLATTGHSAYATFDARPRVRLGWAGRWTRGLLVAGVAAILATAVWSMAEDFRGLAPAVDQRIAEAGAANPVTAVLLNFRSWDTLLEIGVLLLALTATWALGGRPVSAFPGAVRMGGMFTVLARFLVPLLVLTGIYLVWAGTNQPGGAFQAGTLIGAAGIVLLLSGLLAPHRGHAFPLRVLQVFGLLVFLSAGLAGLFGGHFLEYPAGQVGAFILGVELALTVSIAVTLGALFFAAEPHAARPLPVQGRQQEAP